MLYVIIHVALSVLIKKRITTTKEGGKISTTSGKID